MELEHSSPPNLDINLSDDGKADAVIGTGFDAKTVKTDAIQDHGLDHMLKKLLSIATMDKGTVVCIRPLK